MNSSFNFSCCSRRGMATRAVQRSLHEFVFGEMIEAAEGVSVAGIVHVGGLVGAQDVGGEAADARHDAGVLAPPAGIFGHGGVTGVVARVVGAAEGR